VQIDFWVNPRVCCAAEHLNAQAASKNLTQDVDSRPHSAWAWYQYGDAVLGLHLRSLRRDERWKILTPTIGNFGKANN
jgi:hypothetical protein